MKEIAGNWTCVSVFCPAIEGSSAYSPAAALLPWSQWEPTEEGQPTQLSSQLGKGRTQHIARQQGDLLVSL